MVNGAGIASANVSVQVNCGHNEWAWTNGSDAVNGAGVYGTLGVAAASNVPGSRQNPATWTDAAGNLWLFGGYDLVDGNYFLMSDLWKFSAGEWTWVGGPNVGGMNGTYGSLGVPSMSYIPAYATSGHLDDASGDFWLFGRNGLDSIGAKGQLNHLWRYHAGEWTGWVALTNSLTGQSTARWMFLRQPMCPVRDFKL